MAAIAVTAASVIPSAVSAGSVHYENADGTPTKAYEAITAGQILYQRSVATEGFGLATCTGSTPLCHPIGIAGNNAAAGQTVDVITSDPLLTMNAVLVIGRVYVLGATPGAFHVDSESTTNWKKSTLGIGLSTTTMSFSISPIESPAMA